MTNIGWLAAVGAFGCAVGWTGIGLLPDRPYMTVHAMDVDAGVVHVTREFHRESPTVADWRVTVVSQDMDAPSCQTVPGPELHQGWSIYEGSQVATRNFDMDVWVGDPGCLERLTPGDYRMFVTWTPRDGSQPVTAYASFSIS